MWVKGVIFFNLKRVNTHEIEHRRDNMSTLGKLKMFSFCLFLLEENHSNTLCWQHVVMIQEKRWQFTIEVSYQQVIKDGKHQNSFQRKRWFFILDILYVKKKHFPSHHDEMLIISFLKWKSLWKLLWNWFLTNNLH